MRVRKNRRLPLGLAILAAVFSLAARFEPQEKNPKSVRTSPNYEVQVSLDMTSPFIPDGRMSLAELSLQAVISEVRFEFDPEEDPLLGRCQVSSGKGKGTFSKLVLNEGQLGEKRVAGAFLSARPRDFAAGLAIESEPTEEDEASARSGTPPEKVRLSFWTEFGTPPITWGSELGSASLPDLRMVFEVPFRDLIQGKRFSVTLPYEGRYPEDKGTWKIEVRPAPKKKWGGQFSASAGVTIPRLTMMSRTSRARSSM